MLGISKASRKIQKLSINPFVVLLIFIRSDIVRVSLRSGHTCKVVFYLAQHCPFVNGWAAGLQREIQIAGIDKGRVSRQVGAQRGRAALVEDIRPILIGDVVDDASAGAAAQHIDADLPRGGGIGIHSVIESLSAHRPIANFDAHGIAPEQVVVRNVITARAQQDAGDG